MSTGNVVEVIGAVVDVEFPRDAVPKVYDALLIEAADGLTLEVQQQLGDGIVRTIAMGTSDGTDDPVSQLLLDFQGKISFTRLSGRGGKHCLRAGRADGGDEGRLG